MFDEQANKKTIQRWKSMESKNAMLDNDATVYIPTTSDIHESWNKTY